MVDVMFLEDKKLDFLIKQNDTMMIFHIACPLKYGIDIWKNVRNSKTGGIRYEGCKMSERQCYNITILFNEEKGICQYIRAEEGILEFGMEQERGNKTRYCKMSVKVPIENCYNALDKIIEHWNK